MRTNVRQSVILTDRFGDKSEIDIIYGLFWKRYVECKTYSSKLVPLSDVAKFKEVLQLNKIPIERFVAPFILRFLRFFSPFTTANPSHHVYRGLIITSGDYAPRCRNIGIECWDGKDFGKQERKWIWIRRFRVFTVRSVIATGAAVFLYSMMDDSRDLHDQAEKLRREGTRLGKEAFKTAKGWWDELYKKIGA